MSRLCAAVWWAFLHGLASIGLVVIVMLLVDATMTHGTANYEPSTPAIVSDDDSIFFIPKQSMTIVNLQPGRKAYVPARAFWSTGIALSPPPGDCFRVTAISLSEFSVEFMEGCIQ